jgi:hypothetical protein
MRALGQARGGWSAEVAVQQGGDRCTQARKLNSNQPTKLRVHLIEPTIHFGPKVADVSTDLAERSGMFLTTPFQLGDAFFQASHSWASRTGHHGPILHRRREHDACPAVTH